MRRSDLFLPASRERRKRSSRIVQLLQRAGLIRGFGSGLWGFTPVGQRVRRKLIERLRAGMDAVGAQEVHLPALQYRERWEQTGRWENFANEMLTLQNRDGQKQCLAPSHEEGMGHLVDGQVRSYEDLPLLLYQVNSKFRDDHARNGLVRCKEFTMKDAYSFHAEEAGLRQTYQRVRSAYESILTDLGLEFAIVEADNSVMGGSHSEEFVAPVDHGSDRLVYCAGDCRFGVTAEQDDFDTVEAGSDCPQCGSVLRERDGTEVGHIFELGTRYASAMDITVDTADGETRELVMGSYGIGVERLLQTIAQQHAAADGLRWPVTEWGSIAPYRAAIVPVGYEGQVEETADGIYEELGHEDVLLFDDRDQSAGERFAESDLLGIPVKIVLGNGYRETGLVELETRDGETRRVAPEELSERVDLDDTEGAC